MSLTIYNRRIMCAITVNSAGALKIVLFILQIKNLLVKDKYSNWSKFGVFWS